ncbi:pilus assembly protein CpaB [Stenotrophomonas rhizophila]|uniref:Flp pilus assembly protein CpaB n=1 Tax=Stenotrophomonas rhizophila TaxID=216778 RepID=UPI000F4C8503|nr:Flp pilus assembly protein CpaB [Stenotrophomonas rhizophila]ROP80416.1 pilus assembly protein CpaB [Stenotrophomonas rhizophila]
MLKLTRVAAVLLIGLAVILAIVAFGISRRAAPVPPGIPATASAPAQPATWPVVEAAAALPAGRPIASSDLRLTGHAEQPTGGYTSINALIGAVPTQDIAMGTRITTGQIAQGFSLRLNPGERALAVPVDELAAAGNRIQPGDFVDVFLNLRASGGLRNDGDAQTRLLLSRLRVLSYGAHDLQTATDLATDGSQATTDSRAQDITGGGRTSSSRSDTATAPARSAVLAVPVAEANRLLLGAQQGKLFLALRNPADIGLPDPSLYPAPGRVLSPRRELSAEERLALQRPENDAYAGLDTDALAGRGRSSVAALPGPSSTPRRASPRADRGIEIIRGDVSSHSGSR